jgi:hypothetical protein
MKKNNLGGGQTGWKTVHNMTTVSVTCSGEENNGCNTRISLGDQPLVAQRCGAVETAGEVRITTTTTTTTFPYSVITSYSVYVLRGTRAHTHQTHSMEYVLGSVSRRGGREGQLTNLQDANARLFVASRGLDKQAPVLHSTHTHIRSIQAQAHTHTQTHTYSVNNVYVYVVHTIYVVWVGSILIRLHFRTYSAGSGGHWACTDIGGSAERWLLTLRRFMSKAHLTGWAIVDSGRRGV